MTAAALEFLRAHQTDMVEDLRRLVEHESPSGDGPRLDALAQTLATSFRGAGASVDLLDAPDGNCHLRAEWGASADSPVLLLGHFDTVWPVGTLDRMLFRIEGDTAFGPGAFDMKAGIVQGLWAMRALHQGGGNLPHVVFLCTSDEEVGSGTSREIIEREARNAVAAFVLEPSQNGALKTARKGVGQFHLTVHGRAAHAGLDPEAGASAIDEMARQILAIRGLARPEEGTTINVGVVQGGTRSNVIADHATADIDVRFASQSEAERVEAALVSLQAEDSRTRLEMTGGINRPPMERTPRTEQLFRQAEATARTLGFPLAEVAVGGGSDGNFCAALGTPVLDGMGAVGGGAHAIDEHVQIGTMPERAALLALLLAAIAV